MVPSSTPFYSLDYNRNMKNKAKHLLVSLLRVDVFNRIIVFLSMILFLILPSYILYNIHDFNNNMEIVMPCLLLLGALLGTGSLTLYRPEKTAWVYFLEVLLILILYGQELIEVPGVDVPYINKTGVFAAEFVYCCVGIILNSAYYFNYLLKKRRDSNDEGTNHDTFYDFLNARDSNENIEKQLEKITQKNERNIMARIKSLKFSRVTRLCSAIVFLAVSIFYLALLSGRHNEVDIPLFRVALLGIFVIAFLLGMSFLFPKDFKYVYYYNGILFSVSLILSCQNANVTPFFGIIATAVIFLSFLLTMIVDGRTWMGAKPD